MLQLCMVTLLYITVRTLQDDCEYIHKFDFWTYRGYVLSKESLLVIRVIMMTDFSLAIRVSSKIGLFHPQKNVLTKRKVSLL